MNGKSEAIEVKVTFISRTIFLLSIALFAIATVSIMSQVAMPLIIGLFILGALLFCIGLMVPGILLILRRPNLAYTWLRGRNPIVYTKIHWEELSSDKRRSVYTDSMLAFIFVIAFIVWVISEQR